MRTKTIVVSALSLSSDEFGNSRLQSTPDFRTLEFFAQTLVSKTNLHLKRSFVTRPVAALFSLQEANESLLGSDEDFFMNWGSPLPFSTASKNSRRKLVQNDTEQFHDSESEDIFDLYNACNGVVRDGFLDVEQLNNYTPDEAEELNVARLREIWEHTRTGCLKCRDLVQSLHEVRQAVSDVAEDIDPKNGPELDIDQIRFNFGM